MQLSLFDEIPNYMITKPVRLIEAFGGYGSQALSLKYMGVNFAHWKLMEWAIPSIQAYKDIHFSNDNTDYSVGLSKDDLVKFFTEHSISSNYNDPLTEQQLIRCSEEKLRTIYNNAKATNNLLSIVNVKAEDLEIKDTDKYEYIFCYSFPCQDISLAGKGKGFHDKENSTRSGMLWQVERLLDEMKDKHMEMPQVLLMENVTAIHNSQNNADFWQWQQKLYKLGYTSFVVDINAKDCGIPQSRDRTFMLSFFTPETNYKSCDPIKLKYVLKDILEDEVDEKYYLSDNMINFFVANSDKNEEKGNGFRFSPTGGEGIGKCVTTRSGGRMDDNFILKDKDE